MRSLKSSVLYQTYPNETPAFNVTEYFDDFRKLLHPISAIGEKNVFGNKKREVEFYSNIMGITNEEIDELNEITGLDNLQCKGEIEPIDHKLSDSNANFEMKYELGQSVKSEDHSLISPKKRQEIESKVFSRYILKYSQYVWQSIEDFPDVKQDLNPFDFSNIVYCVKIYCPYLSYTNKSQRVKLLQEIHILGDQYLSDLKDKIICSMDYCGMCDVSNSIVPKTDVFSDIMKKEDYLSSFIFIENQFFNDTRNPCMRDLSQTILEWAKGKQLGPFTTGVMEKTKMKDIKLNIGRPYVYQHQGDCEHVLLISDIRLLQVDDPLKRISFPWVFAKGRCSGKYCMMCGIAFAKWFVMGNSRLTHDKSYFCNNCFKSYNYIDGKKVGNFKAYEYVDSIAVL